ncbi:MAG: 23S rRNA (adenine(2503)-C(2))-methyltransferase RlmN [Dehalococcoidia bacterium]|nr:23S rRNA (adenine(2503)-C(2))-methyltransferase RlmN [Dehalococcoidia bacterium]
MQTLYDVGGGELAARIEAWGEPAYRARQVREWAYRRFARSYDEMTNVPAGLQARLAEGLPFPRLTTLREVKSDDGLTRKRLFRLEDGQLVEAVLMLYDPRGDARGRATVCVSSQAGCAMGCVFCATGQAGFERNLSTGEIIAQVTAVARAQLDAGAQPLTNVVFMGMGEPLANLPAVWPAVQTLNAPDAVGMAARHITISTVGLIQGIRRLADEPLQVGLAVSLHAPDEALRERLIPTAHRYPLPAIIDACRDYVAKTGRRVTFEYCLMDGVNDGLQQARGLAALLEGMLCHVNLIPVNPTPDGRIGRPPRSRTLAFQRELAARRVACTVRVEKGVEISAACGQLRVEAAPRALLDAAPRDETATQPRVGDLPAMRPSPLIQP